MRKLSLAVCALSVSLFACKKDVAPGTPAAPGDDKKVALTIRTNDFLQQVEAIPGANNKTAGTAGTAGDTALATKVSFINYLLFDGAGNLLHMRSQQADWDQDFGTITDSAAPGNYTIVMTASQKPVDEGAVSQLSTFIFYVQLAGMGFIDATPDIFYKKENITITNSSDPVDVNLAMDRLVGNLQVNILDMPQPADGDTTASIQISSETPQFMASSGIANWGTSGIVKANVKRVGLNAFSAYVLNTVSAFDVTIHYVDHTGQPQTKVISNVQCYKNRRTILSGYLFGGAPANSGIKVTLLDSWSDNDNEVQF
ncbi:FimB/Mfa2 family fimbrial subunit [Chitinophaga agrisoli]|uniref:FimB/Mfa2 family fimbrial subunit n=1 Tax=Chitinophaga agrisoli TaxID=2607653 RepID=A0A5B2VIV9_9BACT|nr:FimB/Mfa2 family fimbrial subunit [Chitinophaga agrisoli]KAA2238875.1 FimB/Mfa2 family fimbrial subunit [Chitinophaga agrisoli]